MFQLLDHVDINLKSRFLIKSRYYIAPNPSTALFPGKERMPMNLLLHPMHFEQLFTLMQTLSDLRINGLPHPKAQILSRRVWDILMLLPTNPTVKEKLQNLTGGKENFTCKYCGKVNFKDF